MKLIEKIEKYRLIDHTADIGIEVVGDNLSQLFSNAGYALFDVIADLSLVNSKVSKSLIIKGRDLEELMVNWLGELIYIFATKSIIFKEFNIVELSTFKKKLSEEVEWLKLIAEIKGEKYDCKVHVINTVVKAITYHQLKIMKDSSGWNTRVILDV